MVSGDRRDRHRDFQKGLMVPADDRYLRPCLSCGRPLYSTIGQRKRHVACRRERDNARKRAAYVPVIDLERDLTDAEIDRVFTAHQAAQRAARRRAA